MIDAGPVFVIVTLVLLLFLLLCQLKLLKCKCRGREPGFVFHDSKPFCACGGDLGNRTRERASERKEDRDAERSGRAILRRVRNHGDLK